MSLHIEAHPGEIAKTVLITGDPLRATHYAEKFFQNSFCYNHLRGMMGFTGTYNGKRVSIQGTGIGMPSTALYMHELIHSYQVTCIIRVGTCGAIQRDIPLGQVIIASGAITDSNIISNYSGTPAGKQVPSQVLLQRVMDAAGKSNLPVLSGYIFSTDLFYSDNSHRWDTFIKQGVLAVEMETSLIYAMAAKYNVKALSLLTVSDNIITGEVMPPKDREVKMDDVMKLAFEIAAESMNSR